jgi:hypothetical protein
MTKPILDKAEVTLDLFGHDRPTCERSVDLAESSAQTARLPHASDRARMA